MEEYPIKDAKYFLQELKTNARAQEIIAAMPIPKDEKEAAEGYVRLAAELGYSLTAKEILAVSWEMTKAQAKKKTDDTLSKVSLEEMDLDNVAGGENA